MSDKKMVRFFYWQSGHLNGHKNITPELKNTTLSLAFKKKNEINLSKEATFSIQTGKVGIHFITEPGSYVRFYLVN